MQLILFITDKLNIIPQSSFLLQIVKFGDWLKHASSNVVLGFNFPYFRLTYSNFLQL